MDKKSEKVYLQALGEQVKTLRLKNGWTLQQLANEADIELSQVHRIEQGKINPKYTTLQTLAQAFDIPLSELLKGL
jgi:transcriptional regulator with XRE-family HTH domain